MANSGLPKLKPREKRTERLRDVRLTPAEHAAVRANAKRAKLTVSELVRMRCCRAPKAGSR